VCRVQVTSVCLPRNPADVFADGSCPNRQGSETKAAQEIPDQYEATLFQIEDRRLITGRVANLSGDQYWVQADMNDPGKFVKIKVDEIEDMAPSKVSMMPSGLLDTLDKKEVYDLSLYLKSAMSNSRP